MASAAPSPLARGISSRAMRVREHVFAVIRDVFKQYGFPLQTPAFDD